jgi:hypothetical protein
MSGLNETTVTINVTTSEGGNYAGSFKLKKKLSYRDRLRKDEVRRELLGAMPAGATDDAIAYSIMFSEIIVRSLDSPSWWKDNNNGLGLTDFEPIKAVYDKIQEIEAQMKEELDKRAGEAEKVLTEAAK